MKTKKPKDGAFNGVPFFFNLTHNKRLKELFKISWPLILEQIFTTLPGMVNMMMASFAGAYAVASIGMVEALNHLVVSFFTALTVGGTVVIAQLIGQGEINKAKNAAGQSVLGAITISSVLLLVFVLFNRQIIIGLYSGAEAILIDNAVTYLAIVCFSFPAVAITQSIYGILRGCGNTGTPMIITAIMNVFAVIFSALFIFGLNIGPVQFYGLGITGAALALLLARLTGLIMSIYYIVFRSKIIRLNHWNMLKPNFNMQKVVLGISLPASMESMLFQIGRVISQTFVVAMGAAVATANMVAHSIFALINVPGMSLSIAVMILVGQRLGRGEADDVKKTIWFTVAFLSVVLVVICLISLTLTPLWFSFYNVEPESQGYLRQILYVTYIVQPLIWAISFIVPAGLRATGDVKYTMVISTISMWVFRIIFGYLLGVVWGLGVLGVWIGMYIDWIVRSILFAFRLQKDGWRGREIKG